MDSIYGFSIYIRCTGMAIKKRRRRQYTRISTFILLLVLQLLFSRFISFKVSFRSITFFRPPTTTYIYIFIYSRSISNRYGSLLSALAMGLNIPLGVTVRPTYSNEIGPTMLQLPPCALDAICMVRMWRSTNACITYFTCHERP